MTTILSSIKNGVATISLNRADKCNAMNSAMIHAILQAVLQFAKDDTVKLLLVQGHGQHFCAGADIALMREMANVSREENLQEAGHLAELMYQLYAFPKPTIAMVQGMTMGGGLGLLAACDLAIAEENTIFSLPEVKIGLIPSVISPYVIKAIGARLARYYFLTGERFNAKKALELGLIHQVVANGTLTEAANDLIATLLKNSPHALLATKTLIHEVVSETITREIVQKTAELLADIRMSHDANEGLNAFLDKRAPVWET